MLDPEFVLDRAARERLLDRFGPDAEPWCDGLAGLVAGYCRRWGLELDEALSGGTSRVFLGCQDGARPVVLKLTPDRSIAESEAIALRAWARTPHAVDLLESEPEVGALLLDRVTPGTKAAAWPGLPPLEDFAELLAGLRDAGGQDVATLRSSAEGVEFIYGLIARRAGDPYVSRFVPPEMVARGHALARELAASTGDYGLVHGDLHLSNTLDGGPARGLVAIDPRSSVGDRTWDAIDIAMARVTGVGELDDRISRIAALVPGLNAGRLRQWCQATAVISVVQRLFRYRNDGAVPDKFLLDLAASACERLKGRSLTNRDLAVGRDHPTSQYALGLQGDDQAEVVEGAERGGQLLHVLGAGRVHRVDGAEDEVVTGEYAPAYVLKRGLAEPVVEFVKGRAEGVCFQIGRQVVPQDFQGVLQGAGGHEGGKEAVCLHLNAVALVTAHDSPWSWLGRQSRRTALGGLSGSR